MEEVITAKGIVTDINAKWGSFDLHLIEDERKAAPQKVTVHMAPLYVKNRLQQLPAKNITVTIQSTNFKADEICTNILLTSFKDNFGDFSVPLENSNFITAVQNLATSNLLDIVCNYSKLRHYLKIDATTCGDIVMKVLTHLGHDKFQLQFLSHMNYVHNDPGPYKDYSYWTFGTHWSGSNQYLIGYIVTDKGRTFFSDCTNQILCIFTNKIENIQNYFNNYVLIKNYTVITEIYNSTKFVTAEYLLIDENNIVDLGIKQFTSVLVSHQMPSDLNKYQKFSCEVVSKSQQTAISPDDCIFWLQVKLEGVLGYFRLSSSLQEMFPILQSGRCYDVYYKNPPRKIWNKDLDMLYKSGNPQNSVNSADLAADTHFLFARLVDNYYVLNVSEALSKLINTIVGMVSFQGVISMKLFTNPLSSRTTHLSRDSKFGTPGAKTHKLVFESDGRKLEVYLNNWENLSTPHGLIPNMEVVVHNVLPQKCKYYKSTAVTSIDIVRYIPPVRFETANWHDRQWGTPYYLGAGGLIPNSTVIWGRTSSFSILGLKLEKTNTSQICGHITLVALDVIGESKIIAKDGAALLLLRLMLGLQETAFKQWMQGLSFKDGLNYTKKSTEFGGGGEAERSLYEYLKVIERKMFKLHLKCRKMDTELGGRPVYFLLNGRKI